MKYENLIDWVDTQDKKHLYKAGTKYPRGNKKPNEERVAELMGAENKAHQSLIKGVE